MLHLLHRSKLSASKFLRTDQVENTHFLSHPIWRLETSKHFDILSGDDKVPDGCSIRRSIRHPHCHSFPIYTHLLAIPARSSLSACMNTFIASCSTQAEPAASSLTVLGSIPDEGERRDFFICDVEEWVRECSWRNEIVRWKGKDVNSLRLSCQKLQCRSRMTDLLQDSEQFHQELGPLWCSLDCQAGIRSGKTA